MERYFARRRIKAGGRWFLAGDEIPKELVGQIMDGLLDVRHTGNEPDAEDDPLMTFTQAVLAAQLVELKPEIEPQTLERVKKSDLIAAIRQADGLEEKTEKEIEDIADGLGLNLDISHLPKEQTIAAVRVRRALMTEKGIRVGA